MPRYYLNYGTGAGDRWIDGTLDDAKAAADSGACYTQTSISILNDNFEPVARRQWYGLDFDQCAADYDSENPDIIRFGTFGFYDEWQEV